MEQRAEGELGENVDVMLYCPKRRMQLKEVKTLVRFPGAGERTLPLDSFAADIPRLRDMADSYPRLWKLYVFTSVEGPREAQEAAAALSRRAARWRAEHVVAVVRSPDQKTTYPPQSAR